MQQNEMVQVMKELKNISTRLQKMEPKKEEKWHEPNFHTIYNGEIDYANAMRQYQLENALLEDENEELFTTVFDTQNPTIGLQRNTRVVKPVQADYNLDGVGRYPCRNNHVIASMGWRNKPLPEPRDTWQVEEDQKYGRRDWECPLRAPTVDEGIRVYPDPLNHMELQTKLLEKFISILDNVNNLLEKKIAIDEQKNQYSRNPRVYRNRRHKY